MLNRLPWEGLHFLPENWSTILAGGGDGREAQGGCAQGGWILGLVGSSVCVCTQRLHNLVMSPVGRKETEKEQFINNAGIIYACFWQGFFGCVWRLEKLLVPEKSLFLVREIFNKGSHNVVRASLLYSLNRALLASWQIINKS